MCGEMPAGGRTAWYDNSAASASARRNPEPRRAAAIDSLEIPSYRVFLLENNIIELCQNPLNHNISSRSFLY